MERLTRNKKKILEALLAVAPDGDLSPSQISAAEGIASGSLYPALRDLRNDELVETEWRSPDGDEQPRRYYRLTPDGVLLARAVEAGTIKGTSWRLLLGGDP
ncbi:MAG: PadR family transcriptional regulator [Phycisphaeraceae bacterium]|nr:PadR family transcriptional regulator [Phycisphaeraceae bacterium]